MPQRKNKPVFFILIFVFVILGSIFASGFMNLQQAQNAEQQADYKTASTFYVQAAKLLFWQNNLWEKAGITAAQASEYQNAIAYFQNVNQLSEQGWVWYGTAYFQVGEIEKAVSTFESGLEKFQSPTLYGVLASVYRTQKNWEAEKNTLQKQIDFDSQDAYAHYRLGILLMIYSPADAFDPLNRASTLNPQVDSATQTLITALNVADTQQNVSEKKVTLGRALGLVQEWDLAFIAFEQAIQLDNQNAEAWAWLGETKQQLGQDGSVELNQAVKLNPSSATVRGLRGLYWNRQNDYEKMLREYLLASKLEPENPNWFVNIGDAHTKLGDLISAFTAYQHATELAPQDAVYWRTLANFCAENQIYIEEAGLPSAERAVSLDANDPANLDALGYVYFLSTKYANAEINFLSAIELDAQYFPAHIHLALNYLAQNNRSAAYNSLTYVRDADVSGVYRNVALDLLARYFP